MKSLTRAKLKLLLYIAAGLLHAAELIAHWSMLALELHDSIASAHAARSHGSRKTITVGGCEFNARDARIDSAGRVRIDAARGNSHVCFDSLATMAVAFGCSRSHCVTKPSRLAINSIVCTSVSAAYASARLGARTFRLVLLRVR